MRPKRPTIIDSVEISKQEDTQWDQLLLVFIPEKKKIFPICKDKMEIITI